MIVNSRFNAESIEATLPHADPFIMPDFVTATRHQPSGKLISVVGEMVCAPRERGNDFFSVVQGRDGPYLPTDSDDLLLVNPAWEGFPGHFPDGPVTPGVETYDALGKKAFTESDGVVGKARKVRFRGASIPLDVVRTDLTDTGGGLVDGSMTVLGTEEVPKERKVIVAEGLERVNLDTVGEVTPAHLTEFGAQVAATAAMNDRQLRGSGKLPSLLGFEGWEFTEPVNMGDTVIAVATMHTLTNSGGAAGIDIFRISSEDGKKKQVGAIDVMRFAAVSLDRLEAKEAA